MSRAFLATSARRRGVILLVVVSMLTLFAIVGLSFVLYAESAAKSAQLTRQAQNLDRADVESELLLKFFLGQFIYGTDDVFSAMRGHSLADTMYGFNREGRNVIPYSGMGRFRHVYRTSAPALLRGHNNFDLVNYTWFGGDGFQRDPERLGFRGTPEHDRFINGSVSYTYPDGNNMFLGAVNGDGRVLARSFFREYTSADPVSGQLRGFGPLTSNTNWTSPIGKYLTLRPRRADHSPAFPDPEDEGGDVKNLNNALGGNDSIWIDLNFPVQITPDGRKFKPLFAAFIEDLDNRVNVNVHGNIRGVLGGIDWANSRAGGHQGLGPWEVNLEPVLPANDEARNIFIGNGRVLGRYEVLRNVAPGMTVGHWGRDDNRVSVSRVPFGPFYSRTNVDGNPSNLRDAMRLPGQAAWDGHHSFPDYHDTYANAVSQELRNHPVLFNFLDPSFTTYTSAGGIRRWDDRVFAHSNLEALLRFGDTGSPALTSELFQLCPTNFTNAKTRRLVSTIGFDVDRPGAVPSEWTPGGSQANPVRYQYDATLGHPLSPALPRPPLDQPAPRYSEFDPDWRAVSAALGRMNLNRDLPEYPRPNGDDPDQNGTRRINFTDMGAFRTAAQARREFAEEIYRCLIAVTGAYNPDWPVLGQFNRLPEEGELDALRWLAQLAVNIVDFIDRDDYMTALPWGRVGSTAFVAHMGGRPPYQGSPEKLWVFGTELPRLVLNEVYAEQVPGTGVTNSRIRFWVELHNPLRNHGADDPEVPFPGRGYLTERGSARLQVPRRIPPMLGLHNDPYGAYQLVVAVQPTESLDDLREPHNVVGDVRAANKRIIVSNFESSVLHPPPPPFFDPFQPQERQLVRPTRDPNGGRSGRNEGYFVLGPPEDFPGPPGVLTTLRIPTPPGNGPNQMAYSTGASIIPPRHTILLRRLACPHLPPETDTTSLNFNPYVTVDYLGDVPTNAANIPIPARRSFERQQPYTAQRAVVGTLPQSFFQVNSRADARFTWLAFHDRPLINPMELLDVPGYRPFDLTQKFDPTAVALGHRAPWFEPRTRLYRLFEFLEAGVLLQGVTTNGRAIGKINLNTIWDRETFDALVNRREANKFSAREVTDAWRRLLGSRSPNYRGTNPQLGPRDRPFVGFAAPYVENDADSGLEATFLRADPADRTRRLFQVTTGAAPEDHSYYQFELLRKLMSNATARSNVFAVHLTVGFFEVHDDSDKTRPPILGAEIGRAENRHIRHRMFAIVDRTNLTVSPAQLYAPGPLNYPLRPGPRPFFMNTESRVIRNSFLSGTVTVPRVPIGFLPNRYEDNAYLLSMNDRLVIDTGVHQRPVRVVAVNPISRRVTATFTREHNRGVPLSNVLFPVPSLTNAGNLTMLGHPGPQPRFDPHNGLYSGVVRYLSVIVK